MIPASQEVTPVVRNSEVVGSFAVRYTMFDVVSCLGFGVLGWQLRRFRYPVAPIVLGMVLGGIAENKFRQAVSMGGFGIFYRRHACLAILGVSLVSLCVPIVRQQFGKRREDAKAIKTQDN